VGSRGTGGALRWVHEVSQWTHFGLVLGVEGQDDSLRRLSFDQNYMTEIEAVLECMLEEPWMILEGMVAGLSLDLGYDSSKRRGMLDSDAMLNLVWTHAKGSYGRSATKWVAAGFEDGSYIGYDMTGLYHNYSIVSELVDGGENSTCGHPWNISSWCYSNRVVNYTENTREPVYSATSNYDCRTRPWYKEGIKAPALGAWTDMYTYVTGGDTESETLAFDAVRPMYDRRRNRVGVADVSISLGDLNDNLQDIMKRSSGIFAFVVDGNFSTGNLVATTDSSIAVHDGGVPIPASDSNSSLVRELTAFFSELDGVHGNLSQVYALSVDDGNDYWAEAAKYDDQYGLSWHFVVAEAIDCPAGYGVSNDTGLTGSCSGCLAGTYSLEEDNLCFACDAGRYSIAYSEMCEDCPRDTYTDTAGTSICDDCETGTASHAGSTSCALAAEGYFLHDKEGFLSCSDNEWKGIDCSMRGSTLSNLHLHKGFWRSSSTADQIFECRDGKDGPCRGGNQTESLCRTGSTSYLCSVCEDEWYSYNFKCHPCKFDRGIFILTAFCFLFVLIGAATIMCCYGEELEKRIHYFISPAVRSRSKILVSFSQIMFTLPGMLALAFPTNFEDFLNNVFRFLSLSFVVELNWLSCLFSSNYVANFLISTVSPVVLCFLGLLGMAHAKNKMRVRQQKARLQVEDPDGLGQIQLRILHTAFEAHYRLTSKKYITAFLLISYVILPRVSITIFSLFVCDTFEDGTAPRLRADYSIKCAGTQYNAAYWFSCMMVLIYPIGLPTIYFLMLFSKRKQLNPKHFNRDMAADMEEEEVLELIEKDKKLDIIRFLFDMYHPETWWWEVFETIRRISLTGALMVFKEGSVLQLFLGVTICVLSLMMYSNHMPFIRHRDSLVAIFTQLEIYFVLIMGILLTMVQKDPDSPESYTIGILLIVTAVLTVLVAVFIGCCESIVAGQDMTEELPLTFESMNSWRLRRSSSSAESVRSSNGFQFKRWSQQEDTAMGTGRGSDSDSEKGVHADHSRRGNGGPGRTQSTDSNQDRRAGMLRKSFSEKGGVDTGAFNPGGASRGGTASGRRAGMLRKSFSEKGAGVVGRKGEMIGEMPTESPGGRPRKAGLISQTSFAVRSNASIDSKGSFVEGNNNAPHTRSDGRRGGMGMPKGSQAELGHKSKAISPGGGTDNDNHNMLGGHDVTHVLDNSSSDEEQLPAKEDDPPAVQRRPTLPVSERKQKMTKEERLAKEAKFLEGLRQKRPRPPPPSSKSLPPRSPRSPPVESSGKCDSCGKPPGGGNFCMVCGAKQHWGALPGVPPPSPLLPLPPAPTPEKSPFGNKSQDRKSPFQTVLALFGDESGSEGTSGRGDGRTDEMNLKNAPNKTPTTPPSNMRNRRASTNVPQPSSWRTSAIEATGHAGASPPSSWTVGAEDAEHMLSRSAPTEVAAKEEILRAKTPENGGHRKRIRDSYRKKDLDSPGASSASRPQDSNGEAEQGTVGMEGETERQRRKREKAERKAARAWKRSMRAKAQAAAAAEDGGGTNAATSGTPVIEDMAESASDGALVSYTKVGATIDLTQLGGVAPVAVESAASAETPVPALPPTASSRAHESDQKSHFGREQTDGVPSYDAAVAEGPPAQAPPSYDAVREGPPAVSGRAPAQQPSGKALARKSIPDDEEAAHLRAMFAHAESFRQSSRNLTKMESQRWLDSDSDDDPQGGVGGGLPLVPLASVGGVELGGEGGVMPKPKPMPTAKSTQSWLKIRSAVKSPSSPKGKKAVSLKELAKLRPGDSRPRLPDDVTAERLL